MDPCCKGSLQKGTTIIAVSQLVSGFFAICLGISGLAFSSVGEQIANSGINRNGKAEAVSSSLILIFSGVVAVLMSTLLFYGAIKGNRLMCIVWFDLSVICLVFAVYSTISMFISSAAIYITIINVISLLVNLYFLWVVWAVIKELDVEDSNSLGELKPFSLNETW